MNKTEKHNMYASRKKAASVIFTKYVLNYTNVLSKLQLFFKIIFDVPVLNILLMSSLICNICFYQTIIGW